MLVQLQSSMHGTAAVASSFRIVPALRQQVPPLRSLRFAPVGMTERSGWLEPSTPLRIRRTCVPVSRLQ
jgi:hypothetical protein